MARASPGPHGHAPAPPAWLATAALPIVAYAAGAAFCRCHRTRDAPIFFGPPPGSRPKFRFDAPRAEFRTLYVGLSLEAAIVETLCRNPARRTVDFVDLELRSRAVLTSAAQLRLVKAHGDGLAQLGTTAALATGPYAASRVWAHFLWSHKEQPDGLVYPSRHNPELLCAAIFDRSHATFTASTSPLLADTASLAAILLRHGKSVSVR